MDAQSLQRRLDSRQPTSPNDLRQDHVILREADPLSLRISLSVISRGLSDWVAICRSVGKRDVEVYEAFYVSEGE